MRRHLIRSAFLCLLGCAAIPAQDIIHLSNGKYIAGSLLREDEDFVSIGTDNGVIRFRRDLIAGIELSFTSRRRQIPDDDLHGLLELARWGLSKGLKQEAMQLLRDITSQNEPPIEALGLYANLLDREPDSDPQDALPYYRLYQTLGGSDREILQRLAQIEHAIEEFENQQAGVVAEGDGQSRHEGLEARGSNWRPESGQWSNPVQTQLIKLNEVETADGSDVNRALKISFSGGSRDKATVWRNLQNALPTNGKVEIWAYNPEDFPIQVALAIVSGRGSTFHESPQIRINPSEVNDRGWTKISFELGARNWKSERTDWQNNGTISGLDDVRKVYLLIYNREASGELFIDDMVVVASEGV